MNAESSFCPQRFLKNVSTKAGIYQMYDDKENLLYVGKARNLKKRLSSYFQNKDLGAKTASLVKQVERIEVTVTRSENEALLLESNLIKSLKPRYNVLLRDDKSYPYVYVSSHQTFPRIELFRGKKLNAKGRYFGPYPSVLAVRETLNLLQKIFKLRTCRDSFFNNRSRPCLQYQIKRCSAPCVGLIDEQDYQQQMHNALRFLEGKCQSLLEEFEAQMEAAAQGLEYEKAALYRDQIRHLRKVQEQQVMTAKGGDVDILAIALGQGAASVVLLSIRQGRVLGSKSFFPKIPADSQEQEILSAFIAQYYSNELRLGQMPEHIVTSCSIDDDLWLEQALSEKAKRKMKLQHKVRGLKAQWLKMAIENAGIALNGYLSSNSTLVKRFESLRQLLKLESIAARMECFDISHTSGQQTVASCVVFDAQGPVNSEYRRYNIDNITPGDDYGAMRQALTRRYKRVKKSDGVLPDVLIIDGGKGQVRQAIEVLDELQINEIEIVGVAKGPSRKVGLETLILVSQNQEMKVDSALPALHLIQHIRDEAHRFAITSHRKRRTKQQTLSPLEGIEGIGPKRRSALLKRFGGWQELKKASVEEMAKVPGVSLALAQKIKQVLDTL